MADEVLMLRLRRIATDEGISLSEVIRQGLEWRADQTRPRLSFTGAGAAREDVDPVEWSAPLDVVPQPDEETAGVDVARYRALAERRARELTSRATG